MRTFCRLLTVATLAAGVAAAAPPAQAEAVPTKVLVRAISRDAKVISSHVGGARITIRDVATGAVLAEGIQQGGSGDTRLIMQEPHARGTTVYDTPNAASYVATLLLERPTVVEVTAEGPLSAPQAMQRTSKTLLLVPGQDVLGEGILLEIHGFIVELLAPDETAELKVGQPLEVQATVRMA